MLPLFRRRVSKKSRNDSTLPQKSQQKIQDTLPQKSQHKIKIRYHSSAEESAKNQDTITLFRRRFSKKSRYASTLPQKSQQSQDTLPLFRRRVSLSSGGLTHISPKKYIFYGVDAYSPNLISHWWGWRIFPHIKSSWSWRNSAKAE